MQNPVKRLPITVCPACGGTWFREVTLNEFLPQEMEWVTLSWGCELGRINRMPMTVLICFCGTVLRPRIGSIRGGRTPNWEITQFFKSFNRTHVELEHSCLDLAPRMLLSCGHLPTTVGETFQELLIG
jgi:hypothetical protein